MRHHLLGASAVLLALLPISISPVSAAVVTWSVNHHKYEAVLVSQGLSWFDAEQAVEARGCGWYLATLTSKAEDQFVFGLFKNNKNFFVLGNGPWLGGYQKDFEEGARRRLGLGDRGGSSRTPTGRRVSRATSPPATRRPSPASRRGSTSCS